VRVTSLDLANFRNYAALHFEPPGGVCIFLGANAQGKSNLLEALSLLATGKSFRAAREADLIRSGTPLARVAARVRTKSGEVQAACIITRVGDNTKIVLTGDPYQIDNPYEDATSNGLVHVAPAPLWPTSRRARASRCSCRLWQSWKRRAATVRWRRSAKGQCARNCWQRSRHSVLKLKSGYSDGARTSTRC